MKGRLSRSESKEVLLNYLREPGQIESEADGEKELAQWADIELNPWFEELRSEYPAFVQWLHCHAGFAIIKAYIIRKKSISIIKSLKIYLKKEDYLGLVKMMVCFSVPFSDEQLWELLYFTNASLSYKYNIYRLSLTAKYFIAVCKLDGHNYVLVGCDDSQNEMDHSKRYIFSAVGKVFNVDVPNAATNCATGIYRVVCSSVPAVFNDEEVLKPKAIEKGSSTKVQYRAYELSYEQYIDYTNLLKKIPSSGLFNYYMTYAPRNHQGLINNRYAVTSVDVAAQGVPIPVKQEREEKTSNLKWKQKDYSSFTNISIHNTCRHSALHVLDYFNIRDSGISSFWRARLPNQMEIKLGKIVTPLFIIPIPPELKIKKTNPLLYKVLKKLHDNIVHLSKSNYGVAIARRKINALSELYKQLHEIKNNSPSNHDSIRMAFNAWKWRLNDGKQSNIMLINQPRRTWLKWSLFHPHKTASTLVIEEIGSMIVRKRAYQLK